MSREGGEGKIPTPVQVPPPPNAAISSESTAPQAPSIPVETLKPQPPTPSVPRTSRDKTWKRPDGTTEAVKLLRRGDRNTRIMTSEGEKLVPNTELS